MPKTLRKILGDHGEDIACQFYIDHGYEIVGRNVNITRVGEIDIIAHRCVDGKSEYVFVEVKTRSSVHSGQGYEAVTHKKRITMRNCAMAWISDNIDRRKVRASWRLDVVSIITSTCPPRIRVFKNVEV